MKKSKLLGAAIVMMASLVVSGSSHGAEVIWLGEQSGFQQRVLDSLGGLLPLETWWRGEDDPPFGGMTTVGNEVWVGFRDSSTVLRLDFQGNELGSLPAFTTESTGGMTTVGNEVWWGSADGNAILRLDFDGNVVGSVDDPTGFRADPTGGMATVGDEVWWGPAGAAFLGGALWRYDLMGNWLGSPADPLSGLIQQPIDRPTGGMTTVGDEVWWAEAGITSSPSTPDIYRLDFSGNVLGSFCIPVVPPGSCFAAQNFGAMTAVPMPAVPSIHPIALYTLVPGLLVGAALVAMRRR